jgi:hypothetical protein
LGCAGLLTETGSRNFIRGAIIEGFLFTQLKVNRVISLHVLIMQSEFPIKLFETS